MPKQTARQRAMASGTLLCLAHPDGRLACAKTKKLLPNRVERGYARVEIGNYDDDVDDHSLRLALWFYDAKKKKPAKQYWCYVASMAADGYEWVDDASSAPAPKKRKTK